MLSVSREDSEQARGGERNVTVRIMSVLSILCAITLLTTDTVSADERRGAVETRNILFYGNSYTNPFAGHVGVPFLVQELASIAGTANVNAVNAAANGQDFAYHLANNTSIITTGLGAGETWDCVVMQNFSTRPTVSHPAGNLTQHRTNAVTLYQTVAAHSPDVRPVLFETWARALGSADLAFFTGGQTQMQQELRDGYSLAAADIDAAAGAAIVSIAPVGDAWENALFDDLHITDRSHANARGRFLSALVIYATLFCDNTNDLYLDGSLDDLLTLMGLSSADGASLTQIADATTGTLHCCPGDATGDGAVDFNDLNVVLSRWNQAGPAGTNGDVTMDGVVDFNDLNEVLSNWSADCG